MKRPVSKTARVIGLTGGYGTGKSTVARMLKSRGVRVIDADKIGRRMIEPGQEGYAPVLAAFGKKFLRPDGSFDRRMLAGAVFGDRRLRKKLEGILHPLIIERVRKTAAACRGNLVIDAPLLFETGLDRETDAVIVVTASPRVQMERLRSKTRLPEAEIRARIRSQMPLSKKVRKADFIIDNNGSLENTKKQTESLRRKVWKS